MTEVIKLILVILAVYRISRMIVGEAGPFAIFDKIRSWVYSKYDTNHWIYNGIGCPLCISFWLAAVAAVYLTIDPLEWFISWMGIAGAVTLIYRNLE